MLFTPKRSAVATFGYFSRFPKDGRGQDPWHAGKSVGQYARNVIAEEIVAFANTLGGVVCIGINETKDNPKRADSPNPLPRVHDLARQLRQAVYDIIDPPLPLLEAWGIDLGAGSGVVLLRVSPSHRRPHRQQANKEVFIRRSDESARLSMREIQDLTIQSMSQATKIDETIAARRGEHRTQALSWLESTRTSQEGIWGGGLQLFGIPTTAFDLGRVVGRPQLTNLLTTMTADFGGEKYPCVWPHAANLDWRPGLRRIFAEKQLLDRKTHYSLLTNGTCEISLYFKATEERPGLFAGWLVGGIGTMLNWIDRIRGTSNNCPRLSGTPNLPTNDSALFSFRFCTVHPKDVRDCQLRQLFEVPLERRQALT
jgi:Putative DNA-binding domain